MYKMYFNGSWYEFEDYKDLVKYFAGYNNFNGTEFFNSHLDRITCNGKDTFIGDANGTLYLRDIWVIDENGNNVYDSFFVNDVKNCKDVRHYLFGFEHSYKYHHKKTKYYSKYGLIPDSAYPEFRKGPWPNISCLRGGSYCRSIRTTNERRLTANPENEPFNRGSRGKNLPDNWDKEFRDWRDDGWKSQGKFKHQWEHNVYSKSKNRSKGLYIDKKDYKHYIEEIDDLDLYEEGLEELG